MKKLRIAIDGVAASGKSTLGRLLAKEYNLKFISTGLMYRVVTKILLEKNLIDDIDKAKMWLQQAKFDYDGSTGIFLNGNYYNEKDLHQQVISQNISKVANNKTLRTIITNFQIKIGKANNQVLEGRDTTSLIMKDNATHKFFIKCDAKTRAKRRIIQFSFDMNQIEEITNEIKQRDKKDQERILGPLIKTTDSKVIDTTNNSITTCLKIMQEYINNGN